MGRGTRRFAVVLGVTSLLLVGVSSASASYHLVKIRSIFRGPAPSGAFIELQMYADGQNLVGGHQIRVYNAAGTLFSGFTLPSNVANGQNQRRILLGDSAAPGSPDFTIAGLGTSLTNGAAAGAACWDTVDCVSWGTFSGEANLPSAAGTPIAGGLSGTMVSVRSITRGCPTALDEADDTNDSSADFGLAVGYPMQNNSVTPTETLCASPTPPATTPTPTKKKKCKKKKHRSAEVAKKKKCKKRK
jgi:hypothetical protein